MPAKCGIYCILNKTSGDCYVGKASNIHNRKLSHFYQLRQGEHHSRAMQESFVRCGESAFAINVLEICEPEELAAKEYLWMLRVRPAFNVCTPDYAAIARGGAPDGRLRRHKDRVNREPSRFICRCGQLKSLASRSCLACMKLLAVKMIQDGYLPDDHRFEWQADRAQSGSALESLRGQDGIRSRIEYFPSDEPNRPSPAWLKIKTALTGRDNYVLEDQIARLRDRLIARAG